MIPALFVLALSMQSSASVDVADAALPEIVPGFASDSDDDGDVVDAVRRKKPIKRKPVKPVPRPAKTVSPVNVGLAGAGGAAIGATLGMGGISIAGLFASQIVGPQPPEVILATSLIAIGIAVATPFMAGLGGGAGVLLADSRSRPDEWSGLIGCATTGCCAGVAAIGGGLIGGGGGLAPGNCLQIPSPDRPAEWTAGAAMAGLIGGGLTGVVGGYLLAPDKSDPVVAMGIGAVGGAILGSATLAGFGGGIAASLRQ
jgi:hypothetical protein